MYMHFQFQFSFTGGIAKKKRQLKLFNFIIQSYIRRSTVGDALRTENGAVPGMRAPCKAGAE
jgi:hypothetical protein